MTTQCDSPRGLSRDEAARLVLPLSEPSVVVAVAAGPLCFELPPAVLPAMSGSERA
jgi:hypothetical protein